MRGFCLEVAGDFACFTRPEMKVERVSYDVVTPSAARAIFSAILWKPAIKWQVTKIEVLNPIKWFSIRRNEVSLTASPRSNGILIEDSRQQRAGLILRDVRYRLYAAFEYIPPDKRPQTINPTPKWLQEKQNNFPSKTEPPSDENEKKYAAMFARRASRGQCFMQPYLGCREFACTFKLIRNDELAKQPNPINETKDLGFMFYDFDYSNPADIKPMFFRPFLNQGTIVVPPQSAEEVFK